MLNRHFTTALLGSCILAVGCTQTPNLTGFSPLSQDASDVLEEIKRTFGVTVSRLKPNDTRLPWYTRFTTSYTPVKNSLAEAQLNHAKSQEAFENGEFPFGPAPLDPEHIKDSFELNFVNNQLIDEFKKYPIDFFRKQGIHDVYFVDTLKAGFLFVQFDVYGIGFNVNQEKTVILSTEAAYDRKFATSAFHHELFHVIDEDLIWGEETWGKCQPTSEEKIRFHDSRSNEYHPEAGFASIYATSIFREDKAEVFRFLMSGGQLSQYINHWVKEGDSALGCKRDWIKNYLIQRFPEFNKRYFTFLNLGLKGEQLYQAIETPETLKTLTISESYEYPSLDTFEDPLLPPPLNSGFSASSKTESFGLKSSKRPDWTPPKITMPTGIGELKNLEELTLENNQWTALSPELSGLSHLKKLKISGQKLEDFPTEITELTALETLDFVELSTTLPPQMGRLVHLTDVNLNVRPSTDFGVMAGLPIKNLSFSQNATRAEEQYPLNPGLDKLTHLETLSMGGLTLNQLEIPAAWHNIKTLNLDLQRAKLPIQNLMHLNKIEHLILNTSSEFPFTQNWKDLAKLTTLETLHISIFYPGSDRQDKPTEYPPLELLELPHLKELSFYGLGFRNKTQQEFEHIEALSKRCEERGIACGFS